MRTRKIAYKLWWACNRKNNCCWLGCVCVKNKHVRVLITIRKTSEKSHKNKTKWKAMNVSFKLLFCTYRDFHMEVHLWQKNTQNACQSSVCVLLDDDEGRGNVKPLLTLLPGPYQPGVIMHRCTLSLGSHRTVTPAVWQMLSQVPHSLLHAMWAGKGTIVYMSIQYVVFMMWMWKPPETITFFCLVSAPFGYKVCVCC